MDGADTGTGIAILIIFLFIVFGGLAMIIGSVMWFIKNARDEKE